MFSYFFFNLFLLLTSSFVYIFLKMVLTKTIGAIVHLKVSRWTKDRIMIIRNRFAIHVLLETLNERSENTRRALYCIQTPKLDNVYQVINGSQNVLYTCVPGIRVALFLIPNASQHVSILVFFELFATFLCRALLSPDPIQMVLGFLNVVKSLIPAIHSEK